MNGEYCQIKRCRDLASMSYPVKGKGNLVRICDKHWDQHCDDRKRFKLIKENVR